MTKRNNAIPPSPPDDEVQEIEEFDPYAPPEELAPAPAARKGRRADATADVSLDFGMGGPAKSARPRPSPKVLIGVAAAVVIAGGLIAYRTVSHRKALRIAMAQAELDIRTDTADGYRKAAAVLAPFAPSDPSNAGSLRAFALGMLALDYRDAEAGEAAEALLVKPERADPIPRWANLARAAVALGHGEAGNAMTAAGRVPGDPVAGMMEGRVAMMAGNLEAALEPLHAAAASEPALAAALALHGDVVRRAKRDYRAARAAYEGALAATPEHVHARAAFGMAKLALMGQVPPADATARLDRLAADPATPPNERGRAALHGAALALRAGDRARAATLLDGAGLDPAARDWAERAAAVEADTGRVFRGVDGAPPSLLSASDDDPADLPAVAAPPPAPPEPAKVAPKPAKPAAKAAAPKKKATPKKAARNTAHH